MHQDRGPDSAHCDPSSAYLKPVLLWESIHRPKAIPEEQDIILAELWRSNRRVPSGQPVCAPGPASSATAKTLDRRSARSPTHRPVGQSSFTSEDSLAANLLFICLYLLIVFSSTVLLTIFGVDILSAFSGSAASMGKLGPGLGVSALWQITTSCLKRRNGFYPLLCFSEDLRFWVCF
jgi:hypothetical protein